MNTSATTHQSKRIQTLVWTGVVLLVVGIVLYWAAEPLARVYIGRGASGSVSTIDEDTMDRIQFVSDKVCWLGLGLIVVGSMGWVNRHEDDHQVSERREDKG